MAKATKRGPRNPAHGEKDYPPVSILLTAHARYVLYAAGERLGISRSNVVEELLRRHGSRLTLPAAKNAAQRFLAKVEAKHKGRTR